MWLFLMVKYGKCIGKYTSPMDGMGLLCVLFFCGGWSDIPFVKRRMIGFAGLEPFMKSVAAGYVSPVKITLEVQVNH